MIVRRNTCLLCGRELEAFEDDSGRQVHPEADDCEAIYNDPWGVPIDIEVSEEADVIVDDVIPSAGDSDLLKHIQRFPLVDEALSDVFKVYGLSRLGGASSGRGWTSVSIFQQCRYKWKKRYLMPPDAPLFGLRLEPEARAIGTLVHCFLALQYSEQLDERYRVLTPAILFERMIVLANPKLVTKAWEVFRGYLLYYKYEPIRPLAVEYDIRDPRNGESCRIDLIAQVLEPHGALQPGTWDFEHKTSARFDAGTLNWGNDGEVIGQIMLWNRLRLEKRFGELKGACVNVIGTQEKEQKFERIAVAPSAFQIASHERDLRAWEGEIQYAIATDHFPRSRSSCINRYGLCDYYDHCASADAYEQDERLYQIRRK